MLYDQGQLAVCFANAYQVCVFHFMLQKVFQHKIVFATMNVNGAPSSGP